MTLYKQEETHSKIIIKELKMTVEEYKIQLINKLSTLAKHESYYPHYHEVMKGVWEKEEDTVSLSKVIQLINEE